MIMYTLQLSFHKQIKNVSVYNVTFPHNIAKHAVLKAMHLLAQNYIAMLPDLTKAGLDVHSGQIYFSPLVHAAIIDIVT